MVERWFREITDQRIRRGLLHSVPELIEEIEKYVNTYNHDPKIFKWTKDAHTFLAKVAKCRKEALVTQH